MITHLKPDILKCEVKWALGSISTNKVSGGDGTPVELFQILKDDTGDCSHEIKRHFLLGRKAITNLDSILKRSDITLPTKVCLVKAMVFPLVMYGCESWTIEKAER